MYQVGDIVRIDDGRTGKVVDVKSIESDGSVVSDAQQEVVVKLPDGSIVNGSAQRFTAINVLKKA